MKHDAQIISLGIAEHDELEVGWRLIIMQLILRRPIRYEAA